MCVGKFGGVNRREIDDDRAISIHDHEFGSDVEDKVQSTPYRVVFFGRNYKVGLRKQGGSFKSSYSNVATSLNRNDISLQSQVPSNVAWVVAVGNHKSVAVEDKNLIFDQNIDFG